MASRSLNKVILIGNLTRDPELKYIQQGNAVCTFGLATNRSWTPSEGGERREETEYHRLVSWGKLAELCSQLLTKGRKVYIEGRLQTRQWETADGQQRNTTEIVVEDMILLDSRKGGNGDFAGDDMQDDVAPIETPKKPAGDKPPMDEKINIDDIPF
jgi:single-strand DNA-binding protein